MADPEEITVTRREDGTEEQMHPAGDDPSTRVRKNVRRRKRKNPSGADDSGHGPTSDRNRGSLKTDDLKIDGTGEPMRQTADGMGEDLGSPQEVLCARFYEHYRKVANVTYQKPGAHGLRRIFHIPGLLLSVFSTSVERSACRHLISMVLDALKENYHSDMPYFVKKEVATDALSYIYLLPVYFFMDAYRLQLAIIWPFTAPARRAYSWLRRGPERQTTVLDLRYISWTLRTSLDGPVRLSALNYLATMTLVHLDPSLVVYCFDLLISCVKVTDGKVTITQGLEQLAASSALCCLHTLSHLTVTGPMLRIEDIRQQYARAFPSEVNFDDLPFSHILGTIHNLFYQTYKLRAVLPTRTDKVTLITWRARWARQVRQVQWKDYKPSSNEHIVVAHALAKLARFEYRRRGHEKVPRWLLCFAFHSLSQDPLPPTSVVINCLSIIAIDLGCCISNTTVMDESEQLDEVSHLITQKLETTVEVKNPFYEKRKAISALLTYAGRPGRRGGYVALDALLHATRVSQGIIWNHIVPTLFNETSPLTIVLVSPHVNWHIFLPELADRENLISQWAAAVAAVPDTEEVGWSVVEVLLLIMTDTPLRSRIPAGTWAWLKKQPSLPPKCLGRRGATGANSVDHIRALGDIEILKSYFLLVWSEWNSLWFDGFDRTCTSIRRDFGGIGMQRHREDLVKRLDHILEQLDRGFEYLWQHSQWIWGEGEVRKAKKQYGELRELLLEVDRQAT